MTAIGQMMGDPGTDTELQEVRAAMRAERAKQERDLQAALNEDRADRGPRPKRPAPAQPPAQRRQPRWIAPVVAGRGESLVVIDRSGEVRLRMAVIRAMQRDATALHVRVAVEDGQALIEPCLANDPYARLVREDGTIRGGSLRRELRAAGFGPGLYPIAREPDGCWVAIAAKRLEATK